MHAARCACMQTLSRLGYTWPARGPARRAGLHLPAVRLKPQRGRRLVPAHNPLVVLHLPRRLRKAPELRADLRPHPSARAARQSVWACLGGPAASRPAPNPWTHTCSSVQGWACLGRARCGMPQPPVSWQPTAAAQPTAADHTKPHAATATMSRVGSKTHACSQAMTSGTHSPPITPKFD